MFVSFNLSNVVLKILKSGYKYYTSYSCVMLNTSCSLCVMYVHCESPESQRLACTVDTEKYSRGSTESGTGVRVATPFSKLYKKQQRGFSR